MYTCGCWWGWPEALKYPSVQGRTIKKIPPYFRAGFFV
ncbi:hypothetical protein CHK_0882 [Christensenella hongkongensis]|uniref:Uncharacterized protein n=1 Tax=Christensenella hongkongensis TaxID=270498 RepID=A0A0M2NNC7_9FIRM|nr:hypothetical protein CHK_0882 [Christensenella hongkongensis]